VQLHQTFAHLLSLDAARGPGFEPVAYIDGMENPTGNFANICGRLVRHGFDDEAIRAVIGGNIYRAGRPSGSAPTARAVGAAAAVIPGLSDKDLTVEV
jgi:hypothetical protein